MIAEGDKIKVGVSFYSNESQHPRKYGVDVAFPKGKGMLTSIRDLPGQATGDAPGYTYVSSLDYNNGMQAAQFAVNSKDAYSGMLVALEKLLGARENFKLAEPRTTLLQQAEEVVQRAPGKK